MPWDRRDGENLGRKEVPLEVQTSMVCGTSLLAGCSSCVHASVSLWTSLDELDVFVSRWCVCPSDPSDPPPSLYAHLTNGDPDDDVFGYQRMGTGRRQV